MNMIVISPWSQKFDNGKINAKNYPFWETLIPLLRKEEYHLIQIGRGDEKRLPDVNEYFFDRSFPELEGLMRSCLTWISVDNFLPHFVNCIDPSKWGIVLWGKSDPSLFGYKHNVNLLKSKKYLRSNQFDVWFNEPYLSEAFVRPQMVISTLHQKMQ